MKSRMPNAECRINHEPIGGVSVKTPCRLTQTVYNCGGSIVIRHSSFGLSNYDSGGAIPGFRYFRARSDETLSVVPLASFNC